MSSEFAEYIAEKRAIEAWEPGAPVMPHPRDWAYLIVSGNAKRGEEFLPRYIGPFDTFEEANAFGTNVIDSGEWHITDLAPSLNSPYRFD
jgi:hypothetical protein